MSTFIWRTITNLENSLIDHLRDKIIADDVKLLNDRGVAQTVNVYAGRELNDRWVLPLIQVYFDSKPDNKRLEIGSNQRLTSYLIIIDVRTLLPGQESNIGQWVEEILSDGVDFYDYETDSTKPDNPIKYLIGHVQVDFFSSTLVPMYDDMDIFDKNHYRLACKCWINKKEI